MPRDLAQLSPFAGVYDATTKMLASAKYATVKVVGAAIIRCWRVGPEGGVRQSLWCCGNGGRRRASRFLSGIHGTTLPNSGLVSNYFKINLILNVQ